MRLEVSDHPYLNPTCTGGGATLNQCFTYDRNGNLTAKAGVNAVSIPTTASTNHITGASYDERGSLISLSSGVSGCPVTTDTHCWDLLNRQYRAINSTLGTDFTRTRTVPGPTST